MLLCRKSFLWELGGSRWLFGGESDVEMRRRCGQVSVQISCIIVTFSTTHATVAAKHSHFPHVKSLLAFIAASAPASVANRLAPSNAVTLLANEANEAWRDVSASGHGSECAVVCAQSAAQFERAKNHGLTRKPLIALTTLERGRASLAAVAFTMALFSAERLE